MVVDSLLRPLASDAGGGVSVVHGFDNIASKQCFSLDDAWPLSLEFETVR